MEFNRSFIQNYVDRWDKARKHDVQSLFLAYCCLSGIYTLVYAVFIYFVMYKCDSGMDFPENFMTGSI